MRNSLIIQILSLFLSLVFCPVVRSEVRNLGQVHVFEREAAFSFSKCEQTWHMVGQFRAECEVELASMEFVLTQDFNRQIHQWSYYDGDWVVRLTLNYTKTGYIVKMSGNQESDRFKFAIARKYIQNLLNDLGSHQIKQRVYIADENLKNINLSSYKYIGPLVAVQRSFSLADREHFLRSCEKRWNKDACIYILATHEQSEHLLEVLNPIESAYHLKSFFEVFYFKAWEGFYASLFYIKAGSEAAQNPFQSFARDFSSLQSQLPVSIELVIQKILGQGVGKKMHRDKLLGPMNLHFVKTEVNWELCKSSFEIEGGSVGHCTWPIGFKAYSYGEKEIIRTSVSDDTDTSYVRIYWDNHQYKASIWGLAHQSDRFKSFSKLLNRAIEQEKPKKHLLSYQ